VLPVSAQTKAQAAKRGAALALDLLAFDATLAPAMEHAFGRTFICPVRARNIQMSVHAVKLISHVSA
jgi:chromosome segregation ATPase